MQFWINLLRSAFNRQLPQDPVSQRTSGYGFTNLKILEPYLKRHWRKGILGALAVLVIALLAFPAPLIMRFLVDDVILGKRLDWLVWAVLGLAGVKGFGVAAGMLEQYVFSKLQMDVSVDLQHNLLDHILVLPKAFFDDKEVGYLMSRIASDVGGLTWFFSQTAVYIFTNLIRFIGGVVFLFVLEWRLAIATIIVLPLLVAAVRFFSNRMRALSHHSMEQNANVYSRFEETLSSIPLIKAFVTEKQESERVISEVRSAQRINLEQTVLGSVANAIFNLLPDIAKAVVLVAGVYWVIKGEWTLGSLLAFQSYLGFVYGPALSLSGISLQLQDAMASLDRVSTLLKVVPETQSTGTRRIDHLQGAIDFSNVSFSYSKDETVLEDITFSVKPGEHIAIVGPSGVGKSTLISLLLRFYLPLKGNITFDGVNASEFALDSLRDRLGYVSQSSLLMAGTIRDNLLYGNQDATEEAMEHAARTAGIHEFIISLPGKYDAPVGEKGVNLSEGQKQRLSIARALVKEPDILIFDEPTSALDSLVEKSIFDALPGEVKGKTLFIAAHRLSTVQQADRIMILKDKRLDGFGSHAELISANDYYRSLYS